jgi:hypothetical protein
MKYSALLLAIVLFIPTADRAFAATTSVKKGESCPGQTKPSGSELEVEGDTWILCECPAGQIESADHQCSDAFHWSDLWSGICGFIGCSGSGGPSGGGGGKPDDPPPPANPCAEDEDGKNCMDRCKDGVFKEERDCLRRRDANIALACAKGEGPVGFDDGVFERCQGSAQYLHPFPCMFVLDMCKAAWTEAPSSGINVEPGGIGGTVGSNLGGSLWGACRANVMPGLESCDKGTDKCPASCGVHEKQTVEGGYLKKALADLTQVLGSGKDVVGSHRIARLTKTLQVGADGLLKQGHLADAIHAYTVLTEVFPEDPAHWVSLSSAYLSYNNKLYARHFAKKALELDAQFAPAQMIMAATLPMKRTRK